MADTTKKKFVNVQQSLLEQQLISDYLHTKGYTRKDLVTLPTKQVHQLMAEACAYASLRLAEINARAQFQRKIHFENWI